MKLKKLLVLSLVMFAGISLASCGGDDPTNSEPTSTVDPSTGSDPTSEPKPGVIPTYEEDTVWFHYHRPDGKYADWDMWLWEKTPDGEHIAQNTGYPFHGEDDFGAIGAYPISLWTNVPTNDIGIIIRKPDWSEKDYDSDIFFNLSEFEKDENNIYHVYFVSGDGTAYSDPSSKDIDLIKSAAFINTKRIYCQTNHEIESYKIYENDIVLKEKTIEENAALKTMADYDFPKGTEGNFNSKYRVEIKFKKSQAVITSSISTQPLFKTEAFSTQYNYDGELGAIYSKDSTTFKVWSPVSSEIKLNVYESGTPVSIDSELGSDKKESYEMVKGEKGVFEYTVDGDLNGKYYTYTVTNESYKNHEICDPYAKSAGVNGIRGMIIDFDDERATPEGWSDYHTNIHPSTSMAVYETHVADVSSSSTWGGSEENSKLYAGMIETGTTYTENGVTVKTGFDHIKELGSNTVQILPIFDQDNDEINKSFNWGYNPLNYNVIEGIYSKDPHDGFLRVKEFREIVKAYGEEGINIIMDVVYNHVSSLEKSNFNILVPGYYYRYSNGTKVSSGSGCGNDTASEMYMFRKFIKDSTLFLASTYKLAGYRFDLMGLHDVETMNQTVANLQNNYNPDIVVYGEPWNLTTSTTAKLAIQNNMNDWTGFGGFNDAFRDGVKGSVFDTASTGWATSSNPSTTDYNNVVGSLQGHTGSYSKDPTKNIAYVSCHDNNTLYDKLIQSVGLNVEESNLETVLKQTSVLASSLVYSSQGTSFMNAGDEFLRTKEIKDDNGDYILDDEGNIQLDHNSYQSSYYTNELDYSRKIKYVDVFETYKNLIYIKSMIPHFQLDTKEQIDASIKVTSTDNSYIDYTIDYSGTQFRVIHAAYGLSENTIVDLSGYSLYLDTLNSQKSIDSGFELAPTQSLFLFK